MPNPNTNFKLSDGRDLGNVGITKEYLMSVYPQIANQLITPELWVWGRNDLGCLGIDNTTSPKCTPVTTSAGGANWKQVSGGGYFASAIKTDGTLWTWGFNDFGKLGVNAAADGFSNGRTTPVTTFAGGTNWKQVSCGNGHMAAIKTDGTLWNWGWNFFGQLGLNDNITPKCTPVTTFAGGTNWKQVSSGATHIAAIKTDGTLWNWGYNNSGQLGINNTNNTNSPVTTFAGGSNWKQVSSGSAFTAAIKTDGTLWTWGSNSYGQLGINVAGSTNNRTTPVTTFVGGTNWKQVSCGAEHTAAIKTDGTLWTWGSNSYGQLGINVAGSGTTQIRCTPVTTFAGGTNWKQVAASSNAFSYITAIKTDGTLWTWGSNTIGGLGINNSGATHRCTPVTTFAGGTNWKQVAAGGSSSFAIKTSDDLIGI